MLARTTSPNPSIHAAIPITSSASAVHQNAVDPFMAFSPFLVCFLRSSLHSTRRTAGRHGPFGGFRQQKSPGFSGTFQNRISHPISPYSDDEETTSVTHLILP